ncbi:hypothetical protein CAPTEDRAFT_135053 [Capitella teleta]|uniref:Uncharacterized protein n=1 Tax=Capitella teleta TaxID=283909 RepID=R7UAU6_CAPTE|nr:hypothetical protein CAPTEDRAFT_135053 [Capitella teleta]|eukprot:ELU03460.1 hypothetical protein CAPTEDRAFT_135053 [Capitella teleta]
MEKKKRKKKERVLENNLAAMFDWSVDWQMLVNKGKCRCLHIGYHKPNQTYEMDREAVNRCGQEKDRGVIIESDLGQHERVA